MNVLVLLIPVSLTLGGLGLWACIWTLRAGQYDDLEGDAARILIDDPEDDPCDPAT
ncbi:cbb3-type cytochrome oxidase assembly protein CcoS [Jannaschia sp. Os4]|uniref:cbb3-type cytochrome oxidase assembly protein CcoS n=1 Tax=Jannaschia sp. Os4 TaxID=2807617 RepID=UPI00193A8F65|nr:cbb3-type cytochrome oxidase assembly protein CcoS [Jannaschia sp. Os4]MBM2576452.1 cbb3-type cytochrome oxidase assembly protein CcoS [Jannaschia sp. Os4]